MTEFGRPFVLHRLVDHSGVTGPGIVADGTQFPDGTAAIHWRGDWPTTTPHPSVESVLGVHGHGGDTVIVWADGQPQSNACVWPDCLSDGQQAELAAQVLASERGEEMTAGPDQRVICGCDEAPGWEQRARTAEAALALLHEGEEPYVHENTVASPAQWIWQWNRATPEKRLSMAEHIGWMAGQVEACGFRQHEARLMESTAALARVTKDRDAALAALDRAQAQIGRARRATGHLLARDECTLQERGAYREALREVDDALDGPEPDEEQQPTAPSPDSPILGILKLIKAMSGERSHCFCGGRTLAGWPLHNAHCLWQWNRAPLRTIAADALTTVTPLPWPAHVRTDLVLPPPRTVIDIIATAWPERLPGWDA